MTSSQGNMYHEMKAEITRQKKTNNVTAKDKRPLLLFYFTEFEQVFVG